ncbi:21078_t:CDS:10 [Gigaspora margarita]|uniref:Pre-rRNA-processing protein RIX1 n=1 Tax=Gigaspora margarita TaxID=4874 RepID=A0ABN7UI13_GIGMA|nr:21078_t:CDS:10 [Gigaspora margarita]
MLDQTNLLHSLVVNYTLNDNKVDSFVPFILETIANYQLLDTEKAGQEAGSAEQGSVHKWCTRINSLLQSKVSGAKWAGISFVKISIQQSETLFIQNLQSWSSALLTLLTRPESTLILSDVILTLSNIFGKTINKPELQREVTSQQLPRFNTTLLNLSENQELLSTIFDALSQSCIQFPTIFRPFVENTQKLCLGVLDGMFDYESSVVQSAANCLASITNTGGKTNSLVHWKSISLRLIGSLNFLLDRLFDTIDEEKHASNNLPQFEFPSVSDDYIIAFPILFSRFQCLCECIISLVSLPTSIPVHVPMNQFLDFLCRVYNVCDGSFASIVNKDKNEFYTLMLGVPSLYVHSNKVLSSLIICAGEYFTRHLRLISDIILKLLDQSKDKWLLRNSTYRLTSLCIQKYGIGFVHFVSSPLLASIIDDIRIKQKPQRDVLTDVISNTGKKGGKNKKRKITNSDELINSGIQEFNNVNVDVQISALEVLKTLLMVDGSSIPYNIRSTIDNIILSRILAPFSQLTNSSITTRNESDIQLKLYECLLALIVAPSAFQPTILPHALRIFSSGLKAQPRQLQLFSSQALAICDLMLHSRLPPLQRLPNDSISLSEKNIHESESKETGNNIESKENSNNIVPEKNDNKIEPKENDNIELKESVNNIEPKENIEPKGNTDEHLKNEGETPSIHTLKFSEIDMIPEHSDKKRVHSGDGSDFDAEDQARMFKSFRSDDYTNSDNEDEEMPEIVPDGPDSDYESLDE